MNSVEKNQYGWWYIKNGKVDFSYTGFAKNQYGWWYCKNGKVDFSKKDIIKGTVNKATGWWYCDGGKVQFTDSVEKNSNGWFGIKNGKVDFNYSGIMKNQYGWWRIENGKVNFSYTGMAKNEKGWFFCQNGKVDFSFSGWVSHKCLMYNLRYDYEKDKKVKDYFTANISWYVNHGASNQMSMGSPYSIEAMDTIIPLSDPAPVIKRK